MKRLGLVLIGLVFVSLLACTALAQTTIRITGYGGQDPAIVNRLINEVIGDKLSAEGITVQYEPVEGDYNAGLFNALSAGTAGDVFYIPAETAPGILATGTVLPLNDVVDTSPFIDTLLEPFTVDGQVYGIPKDFNTLAVFYNKDLFDEAGVEYPNENDTWDTFAKKLRGVNDLGGDVKGACFVADLARMGPFAFGEGWQALSQDGNTNLQDKAFVDAFTWYTGLIQEGVTSLPSDLGQDWSGGCFGTGNTGVAIEGAWILGYLRDTAPNLQYGTTFLPVAPSGKTGNYTYTVAYGVNANSANQDAAIKVLEALTSPEAQQWVLENGLAIPSRKALENNPYFAEKNPEAEANRVVFEGATRGNVESYQFGKVGTDFVTPINQALNAVATGQSQVGPALEQAQSEVDALVQRAQ